MSSHERMQQIAKEMADAGVPVASVKITKEDAAFALLHEVEKMRSRLMSADHILRCLVHMAGGEVTITPEIFKAVSDKELDGDTDPSTMSFVMRLIDVEPPPLPN